MNRPKNRIRSRMERLVEQIWASSVPPPHLSFLLPLLSSGSRLYRKALERHQANALKQVKRLPAFVVSVGNLVVGGTGKTPLTAWLTDFLYHLERRPVVLTRGYGRKTSRMARVPTAGPVLEQVSLYGDEPVWLARCHPHVPVWVGRDRWLAGQTAARHCIVDTFVLDDGFQHLSLHRDLDLVLLDAHGPFANGRLLPWGPLREPPEHLSRSDALILTRAENPRMVEETRSRLKACFPEKPVFCCRHRPVGVRIGPSGRPRPPEALAGEKAVAFAGIASPADFFRSVKNAGIQLCGAFAFPDHHPYHSEEIRSLWASMQESGASFLITTEKDMVRLPRDVQRHVSTLAIEPDFGPDKGRFVQFVAQYLGSY